MRLDGLVARIRPRTAWEGLDLGFALGRRWFPALWGLWLLSAMPVGVAAALWLPEHPDLWILLVWWLKPLYEAPLLFWLSRALFGAPPKLQDLWRERRMALPLRLLPSLLWRRLQPSRSFLLPLVLLEGLGGRERRQRRRVIQGTGSTGAWLTVICVHLESILWSSALFLILFLVPEELPRLNPDAAFFDADSAAYWVSAVLYWLAMSVMAPFYVAAGFALYLTRRTELEAWDLELVFRQAEPKERPCRPRPSSATASIVLLALAFWVGPNPEAAVQAPDPGEARALITDVLTAEEFGSKREIQAWVYVGTPDEDSGELDLPDWLRDSIERIAAALGPVAVAVKWLLVLLAVFGGILLLRWILLDLRRRRPERAPAPRPEQSLQTLGPADIGELPMDVEARVRELIAAGDLRAALALLYRAGLAYLNQQHGLAIPSSATELECLTLAASVHPEQEAELLRRLTEAWQRLAYGHRSLDGQELTDLLQDWHNMKDGPNEA